MSFPCGCMECRVRAAISAYDEPSVHEQAEALVVLANLAGELLAEDEYHRVRAFARDVKAAWEKCRKADIPITSTAGEA